jgi:hypothetical protein
VAINPVGAIPLDADAVSFFEVDDASRYDDFGLRYNLVLQLPVDAAVVVLDMLVFLPFVDTYHLLFVIILAVFALGLTLHYLLLLNQFFCYSGQIRVVFHIAFILKIYVFLFCNFV